MNAISIRLAAACFAVLIAWVAASHAGLQKTSELPVLVADDEWSPLVKHVDRELQSRLVPALKARREWRRLIGDRKMAVEDLIKKAEEHAKKFSDTMKHKAAELRGVRREEYERLKEEVEELRRTIERLQAGRAESGGA